jgi:acyl-CoA reductase-like NAD-dependent aldehyde dehydrogenase
MQEIIVDGSLRNQCPVDLHLLFPVPVSTEDEVKAVIAHARAAQLVWEEVSFEKRARLLKQAGRRMLERRQEVMELLHDEAGKTPGEMLMSEVVGPLQYIKDWVAVARPWLKTRKLPISAMAFPGKKGVIEMLPRGVVGIIASWNYPLANYFKPVFAALLCGNSVVIKPSEFTPRTGEWFVRVMNEFLPPGVLSVVQGDKVVGQALIRSGIDAVTFTGSFASGKEASRMAAEQMIPCSVELGGKDAAIVLADCDLDRTVAGVMHWSLHNAGQACGDIERVYLEESIADRFVEKLSRAVSSLRVYSGDTLTSDVGPSVNLRQLLIVEDQVKDALARGAKLICGGKRTGKGLWFEPTILDHCDHTMKVMQEPTFGPVIPIARFKTVEDAIRLANDCEYGLNGCVWSGDVKKATAIARRLQAGTVFVNNHAFTGAIPAAPWTGVKKSGHGIANSTFSLGHYTRPRTVVVDRKKSVDGWWFPMNADGTELGHCLADAQLGKVFSAVKIPFLMARRQKAVINFVKNNGFVRSDLKELTHLEVSPKPKRKLIRRFAVVLGKWLTPRLTRMELLWGQTAMEAIFTGPPDSLGPLSKERARLFLIDFYQAMPFPANLGLKASCWLLGLSPIIQRYKFTTLPRLSMVEKIEVLQSMAMSDNYFLRQIVMLAKMNGALVHASTRHFHSALAAMQTKVTVESTPRPRSELPRPPEMEV